MNRPAKDSTHALPGPAHGPDAATPRDLADIQRRIVAQDFAGALRDLEPVLAAEPANVEALYLRAVCQRYLGNSEAALATLAALHALAPEHGRAHQEEGYVRRGLGQRDAAIAAFGRACRHNPALEASFRALAELLAAAGRDAEAAQVRERLARLTALPRPLVAVTDLIAQGRYLKAERLCRRFLEAAPKNAEGMRLLADIGVRLGVLDDAEFLLESAVAFEPGNVQARIDYIGVLRKRQKFRAALAEAKALLDSAPGNPQFRSLYAIECMQAGDYDAALVAFDEVLAQVPGDPNTLTSRGHALKTCGRYRDAVRAYRDALASQPRHGEAWYALANLKTYEFTGAEFAALSKLREDPGLSHMERVHVDFALGKALEDRGDTARAFQSYASGNARRKAQSTYDAGRMSEDLARQRETCTRELFRKHAGSGCQAPDPIFVVGLPRAGSTLIEQILSSHPEVDGTLELPNVLALSQRLRKRGRDGKAAAYPQVLADLGPDELREFGEEYLRDTRVHRRAAPYFVDKMPNNFRHLGLIRLMLPNAKVIDARRHPMACCFSAFKQLFAEGQEFTYDLADLGRYYRDYVRLMDHWDDVLPGFVLRVQHEDVVRDLEGQVRRLLEFCGLPWDDACLRYFDTEREVRTPSSEQVRRPIFTDALEQWRDYAAYLEPLSVALGPDVRQRYGIADPS